MFYIIGIGLTSSQITLDAKNAIKDSNEVYIDNYTNILSKGDIEELEKKLNKKITQLNRIELEQEKIYLKDKSALLVIGNPFSATTHYSLLEELNLKKIKYQIIAGISIFNYRGSFGLYEYKFGKTVSIVYPEKNYFPTSFYNLILNNLKINAHTLCLLDIKVLENRFMSVKEACEILDKIDKQKILENKICALLSKMGAKDKKIIVFKFKDYKKLNYEQKPQSLVICANLNEFENMSINEYKI
jgi:diphthine synthase